MVGESGQQDVVGVALGTQPQSNVVLRVNSSNPDDVTVHPHEPQAPSPGVFLTFTPENWARPQFFTVRAVQDALVEGDERHSVIISVDDENSHPDFHAVDDVQLDVLTDDDDDAEVGDFVWNDVNGNGRQDDGEPGVPNITVQLWSPGADGAAGGGDDSLVSSTETAADGRYLFLTLHPQAYFVRILLPAGSALAPANTGDEDLDSDFDPVLAVTDVFDPGST